jgi:hypothetical protein
MSPSVLIFPICSVHQPEWGAEESMCFLWIPAVKKSVVDGPAVALLWTVNEQSPSTMTTRGLNPLWAVIRMESNRSSLLLSYEMFRSELRIGDLRRLDLRMHFGSFKNMYGKTIKNLEFGRDSVR